jgi:putative ABC transport system permease protein
VSPTDLLRTAGEAIRSHRLRSALTMLGILIGIAAVILTVGLGDGARAQVQDDVNALGTNLLVVSPGSTTDSSGLRGGMGSASTLTVQDTEAIADPVVAPDVEAVAPVSSTSSSVTWSETNWTTTLVGTTPSWEEVRSREVAEGRFLTEQDQTDAAAVVVLGPDTATELFGSTAVALGQTVTVEGVDLEVVGVLPSVSSSDDTTNNDMAIVPITTYQQRLVGGATRDSVSSIYVKAASSDALSAAYQETNALLLQLHDIPTADDADFTIATQQSILEAASSVDQTMTVMLGGIAVVSLVVGGIGVMNIMLVSVSERVREIGLRKALGARPALIRRQFLTEAGLLGLAGGVVGVVAAVGAAVVIPHLSSTRIELSTGIALLAVVLSIGIGMLFGVYPASRAARLTPIDALRSE